MANGAVWILSFLTLGADGLVWGVAACTVYRAARGPGRGWLAPALVAAVVFVVWDQWLFGELVHWAGFPRERWAPARLLEAGVQIAATLAGFRGGELLVGAIVRRETRSRPGGDPPGRT